MEDKRWVMYDSPILQKFAEDTSSQVVAGQKQTAKLRFSHANTHTFLEKGRDK